MSDVEIAGDSTTSISWILLPNASWPEEFLPLSDVIGGALLMKQVLGQTTTREMEREAEH
jgi:hypothetical protein